MNERMNLVGRTLLCMGSVTLPITVYIGGGGLFGVALTITAETILGGVLLMIVSES